MRKPGKLPGEKFSEQYALEYGTNTLEIHADAVGHGQRVLVVDDLLATGGTIAATLRLLEKLGADVVGSAVLIELEALDGRAALGGVRADELHQVLDQRGRAKPLHSAACLT